MDKAVLHTEGPWFCIRYLADCKKANSFHSFKMKLKTKLVEQYNIFEFNYLFFF